MHTTADVSVPRARDTLDRPDGPHPDDAEHVTPDGQGCVLVDGATDTATVDTTGPLDAAQLAALLTAGRKALLELEGRTANRDRVEQHITREARTVADLYTPGQVRAHLDFAAVVGRDDLDVTIWRRAAELLALVEDLDVRGCVDSIVRAGCADMLAVLELVDRGELSWVAGGVDGPQLHDAGDPEVGRPAGPCGPDVAGVVADLRSEDLIHEHVLRTTDHGYAVVRAAHRRPRLVHDGGAR